MLFHKEFKLNGNSFSSPEEILIYAKKLDVSAQKFLIDWFSNDDFLIVQTSGSTGKPKTISLQKEFMKNSALATGDFFQLKEKTTALLCLSVDYIAGKMMLVRALTLGWSIDVVEPNSDPLEEVTKNYDFSAMVPLQLQNSLNNLDKIKTLIVGGGVVSKNLITQLKGLSTEVYATYGMTETITHIAVKKLIGNSSSYKVLPNVSVTKDSRNCLVINAPKVSKEDIVTNDVVKLISNYEFKWLGRYDNVINSGGIKLQPEILEEKLSSFIGNRFFVTGIPDERLGEKLILIVEGKQTEIDFSSLTKYEKPKETYFIESFVETETKKIQRQKTLDKLFKK